ncbi:MAG TPA: hypothetical protein VF867_07395 [Arthrobacter sp.]
MAGRLPQVLAGEPDAVREELTIDPGPVPEDAHLTDRLKIADLHRAATQPTTLRWKLPFLQ